MNKVGLYLHIPFCNKICSYCDFPKRVSKSEIKTKYIKYLIKEIEMYQENNFDFKNDNETMTTNSLLSSPCP